MGCALSSTGHELKGGDGNSIRKDGLHKQGSVALNDMSDEHFTQQQKCLLRETWELLSEKQQQHGVAIFCNIFATQPNTKQLFPFRELEDDDLLKDSLFRSHSKRFMHAIETTVRHLDALDLILVPVLHRLGERHVKISGFKLEYLSVFIESMLTVFADELGKKFTKEVRATWRHLGKFIASKMTEGYQNALMSMGKYLASQCMDSAVLIAGENINTQRVESSARSSDMKYVDNIDTGKKDGDVAVTKNIHTEKAECEQFEHQLL